MILRHSFLLSSLLLALTVVSGHGQTSDQTSSHFKMKLAGPSLTEAPSTAIERVRRQWLDADGNGWDDLWEIIYPEANTITAGADTDGDGVSDYEEMLQGRDPGVPGPLPEAALTAAQQQEALEALRQHHERLAKERAERRAWYARHAAWQTRDEQGQPVKREAYEQKQQRRMEALAQRLHQKQQADNLRMAEALAKAGRLAAERDPISGKTRVAGSIDARGRITFFESYNSGAADTVATDEVVKPVAQGGYGLTGGNPLNFCTVGLWEISDPLSTHQEFVTNSVSRVTDMDGASFFQTGTDRTHAVHVAATIGAQGTDSTAKGMASAAPLKAYDVFNSISEISIAQAQVPFGLERIAVSNHSYGPVVGWTGQATTQDGKTGPVWAAPLAGDPLEDYKFGAYLDDAQAVDAICYGKRVYLPVWAAGNDRGHYAPLTGDYWFNIELDGSRAAHHKDFVSPPGPDGGVNGWDTVAGFGVAKNVLTVASCQKISGGYTGPANVVMAANSSAGPTDDGRIKPDITAPGVSVYSANYTSTSDYTTLSGTSMAAPVVTGSLALLVEHYRKLHPGVTPPGGGWNLPYDPTAATLKALVIHTADEAGDNPGPDYRSGWGLLNTQAAADLLQADHDAGTLPYVKETILENGFPVSFPVRAIGGQPIKVTICWTDPAATEVSISLDDNTPTLINDLELRVVHQGSSTTYLPWVLDPAFPSAAATLDENHVDTVEQVITDEATAGDLYTVSITHHPRLDENNGPIPLVNDTGAADCQRFSIILSGVDPTFIAPNESASSFRLVLEDLHDTSYGVYHFGWTLVPSIVGAVYHLESSDDLVTWTPVGGDRIGSGASMIGLENAPLSAERKFWRMKRIACSTP
jgi:hypothetical protein